WDDGGLPLSGPGIAEGRYGARLLRVAPRGAAALRHGGRVARLSAVGTLLRGAGRGAWADGEHATGPVRREHGGGRGAANGRNRVADGRRAQPGRILGAGGGGRALLRGWRADRTPARGDHGRHQPAISRGNGR